MLYRQAVYEFVLLEANVGVETIFENVFRIKLGNELLLTNDMMQEKKKYINTLLNKWIGKPI